MQPLVYRVYINGEITVPWGAPVLLILVKKKQWVLFYLCDILQTDLSQPEIQLPKG